MKAWTVLFFAALALVIAFTSAPVIAQEKPTVAQDIPKEAVRAVLPEPSVVGTWEGELQDPRGGQPAGITLYLKQEGDVVRGSFDVTGSRGSFSNIPVTGTFKNAKLSLTRTDLAFSGIEATVDDGKMKGVFIGRTTQQALSARKVK